MRMDLSDFQKRIEFSLCQQFASENDVRSFVEKALKTGVGVICVNPVHVQLASSLIKDRDLELSGNIGFPFGSHPTAVKALETDFCVGAGATQIDMVMDIGALKSGHHDHVQADIEAVVEKAQGRVVKVIIETWVLSDEEKILASQLVEKAGAHMVKTSTGVRTQYLTLINPDPQGATKEDVSLIRNSISKGMRVKASGGIYTLEDAVGLLRAGADQLGVSKGAALIKEFAERYPEGIEIRTNM